VNSLVAPSGYSGNTWSGTSMACPHAAGVAALMLQKNPTLSPAGVDSIMELSSLDLGSVGKDNQFGTGRIDALAAVNLVPATQAPQLSWSSFVIQDATADGVIDPGEAFDVVFTLTNTSGLVAATPSQRPRGRAGGSTRKGAPRRHRPNGSTAAYESSAGGGRAHQGTSPCC
jgi:subtilisin family serine protease